MTEYTSETKIIPYNNRTVFSMLADLSNLERIKERFPMERTKDFLCDTDSCSFELESVGRIAFRIVDREPDRTIRLEAPQSPIPLTLRIQLEPESERATQMKMTLYAELNPFLVPMASKPIREALEKFANLIATFLYE